jgi:acyl CoA:acetate/3-ketoacid CoA transferase beta subunit
MEYPNVKNAYIVPATSLANWAVDGNIAVWLLPDGKRLHGKSGAPHLTT